VCRSCPYSLVIWLHLSFFSIPSSSNSFDSFERKSFYVQLLEMVFICNKLIHMKTNKSKHIIFAWRTNSKWRAAVEPKKTSPRNTNVDRLVRTLMAWIRLP
jgi:hypothetical protein